MTRNNKTVCIFMLPQEFPCGPQSSCCGPVGQSEEEIQTLKSTIEKKLECQVEVINVMNKENDIQNYAHVMRLVRSFGAIALPIIALDDEVISMGNATPEQAVSAIREKLSQN